MGRSKKLYPTYLSLALMAPAGGEKGKGGWSARHRWGLGEKDLQRAERRLWEKVATWFGYKLHLIVDALYELPLGYNLTKASASDCPRLLPLMEELTKKHHKIVEDGKILAAERCGRCGRIRKRGLSSTGWRTLYMMSLARYTARILTAAELSRWRLQALRRIG